MLADTVMRQYARAVTQFRQSEEVRFCFFGLFLFAFRWLILPVPLHFLIRQFLLRRSASFYVSKF
ncbi:MAG: hypothetical protein BHV68_03470 [Bacteroidales bacterium 43_8]|jgi:hypothetical protein|nr:MAG: hypothetical protein BHV68_03470 [Bacteroidales bacterium 43_8]